jgi:hypothetical protein
VEGTSVREAKHRSRTDPGIISNPEFVSEPADQTLPQASPQLASYPSLLSPHSPNGLDYAIFRYRLAINHGPFGQVTVQSYNAIQQKSGKVQFIFNPPETQTCVHPLFPRAGFIPCWYLQRNTEPRTDI